MPLKTHEAFDKVGDLDLIRIVSQEKGEIIGAIVSSVSQPANKMEVKALEILFNKLNNMRFAFQRLFRIEN